jgi:hypothetical protein
MHEWHQRPEETLTESMWEIKYGTTKPLMYVMLLYLVYLPTWSCEYCCSMIIEDRIEIKEARDW